MIFDSVQYSGYLSFNYGHFWGGDVCISLTRNSPLFFHRFQNIAHLLRQKNDYIWSFIVIKFPKNFSTKSTISQNSKIGKLFLHTFQKIVHLLGQKKSWLMVILALSQLRICRPPLPPPQFWSAFYGWWGVCYIVWDK